MNDGFQQISKELNEITIRYVKFKSQLDRRLEAHVQATTASVEGRKLSGYSKSTSASADMNASTLQARMDQIREEADKFLSTVFDLMDTFFNPAGAQKIELDGNGKPKNSILRDFNNGSLVLNGKPVLPHFEAQSSFTLYLFIGMSILLLGALIAIFVVKLKKSNVF